MTLSAKERLIVALDVPDLQSAESLIEKLTGHVGMWKVGMQLYTAEGPKIIDFLHERGEKVFLDLKFHDIPNTVKKAGEVAARMGVYMFNVHAAGGMEMMRQTAIATREAAEKMGKSCPLLLAVTVLTSIDERTLNEDVGVAGKVETQVVKWAKMAQEAGLDGVVASPREIEVIRQQCGDQFAIVTPGVRPDWAAKNDQKRTMTPEDAVRVGATYVVVGRPITQASDPVQAAQMICESMEKGMKTSC